MADNGNTTSWTHDDKIGVRIGDNEETGIYVVKLDAIGRVMEAIPEKAVYWKNTQPATITAWYPLNEELDFIHQDQGLTYLLKATSNGDYQSTPINLNFTHQLAKVRVLLDGTKATEVASVTVRSYPQSVNNQGTLGSSIGTPLYVPMLKTTYEGKPCWEATLRPGSFEADNTFEVAKAEGDPVRVTLAKEKIPVIAGQVTTITINVNPAIPEGTPEITDAIGNISGTDAYVVRGNNRTTPINITGGSPTIYLDGATVAVGNGSAINITNNATPTIYVVGKNIISSGNGAGIYVAEGSTVTITGSSRNDELTVTGSNGGSGIGGYVTDAVYGACANGGNIEITKVRINAYGSNDLSGNLAPGIGGAGNASCGTITIDNATVYAYGYSGGYSSSAIGAGFNIFGIKGTFQTITIRNNSEVSVQRGDSYCDYIGYSGPPSNPSTGDIIATIDNTSTVIKLN